MKLLVTGGLGFIGSNFIIKFLSENPDSKVLNVDAELDGSNLKNLENIKNSKNYEYTKGNISNKEGSSQINGHATTTSRPQPTIQP